MQKKLLKNQFKRDENLVKSIESELKQPSDGIAQYIKVPKEIVWDSTYPFEKRSPIQRIRITIDEDKNVLIISKEEGEKNTSK
ncbi:MAG: hypothetical protein ACTSRA_15670 [Promethearchaeota archaeon]